MRYLFSFFSSIRLMAVLLVIFGISIATATFIENDFGTDAARSMVYNARWFEIILLLGIMNIIGVTVKTRMYSRAKLTLFIFHVAFIIIIIGAGITRFFGREGMMHIREGNKSQTWYTTQSYLLLTLQQGDQSLSRAYVTNFSALGNNKIQRHVKFKGHSVKFKVLEYLEKAEKTIRLDRDGEPLMQLVTVSTEGRTEVILKQNQVLSAGGKIFSFNNQKKESISRSEVQFYLREGSLYFLSSFEATSVSMSDQISQSLVANEEHLFMPATLFYFDSIPIVLKQFLPSAAVDMQPAAESNSETWSAARIQVSLDGDSKNLIVFGKKEEPGQLSSVDFNDIHLGMAYGSLKNQLPFELKLNDFIIKRYPGSESPSWFESNVQLIDSSAHIDEEHRIYMNHILKYKGFRFYQSSYDSDEKGTILSLNRDSAGTRVTYAGYILLALGMFLSLLNRKSRFAALAATSDKRNSAIKIILIGLTVTWSQTGFSQSPAFKTGELPEININLAREFAGILVQDNGGRIKPINTLASEVVHKVSRKDLYHGQTPDQVLLGMWVYPDVWQHEKMIRVGHPEIRKLLYLNSDYAAYVDFFTSDPHDGYILQNLVENAYRKKPAYRSKFDTEIIRVDERMNICYLVYTGALFKIFPDPNDTAYHWYSVVTAPEHFSGKDSVFTRHILPYFAEEVQKSQETGNYEIPAEMIKALRVFQTNYSQNIIPSQRHIDAEIFYNKTDFFGLITRIYLLVGFLLLLILFIHIFIPRFTIRWFVLSGGGIILLTFLLHTFTLILRWYVSGHAPWSNGYEALTFIAWATVLAGLIFAFRSAITISVTAILAGLILMTAHLSLMDPQITNLVPVLQSYWLVIHVAVITTSYGFLGMGALLAAVNLLLMFFQTSGNYARLNEQIDKLSAVIEMTIIAGLYLLAIGTFLGGVWANESWGRYWAWDPKETWALVTVIVYAVILHLRLVPGLKGRTLFNILALIGFASVLMTYFGVNYYLSGLHSYAKGDPLPVPPVVYYSVTVVLILTALAAWNQSRLKKQKVQD